MVSSNRIAPLIPTNLAQRFSQATRAGLYTDITIGGIPFIVLPSDEDPYIRDTRDDRREQFDHSNEAGEQSFGYWWLRSQASFHSGAGQKFLDSNPDEEVARSRFNTSAYLNPWTPGEIRVAGQIDRELSAFKDNELVYWSGIPRLAQISSTNNTVRVSQLPGLTSQQTITLGSSGVCQAITSDGANVFVACNDRIWKIVPGGGASEVGSVSFSGPVQLGFAKQRVLATIGPKIYEIDVTGLNPPVLVYTNPAEDWRYTAIAEGPDGIYVAGYSGPYSNLALISLIVSETGVTLSAPVIQFTLPPSEQINSVFFYLNNFFALATSNGVRVGSFTFSGQAQFGPLIMEGIHSHSITGSGTLLYIGTRQGIYTVDLNTEVAPGRYAHACFANNLNPSNPLDDVVDVKVAQISGVDLVYALQLSGATLFQSSFTPNVNGGTFTTSWARFGTTELKRLHYIRVEGDFPILQNDYPLVMTVEEASGGKQNIICTGGGTSFEYQVNLPPSGTYRVTFKLAGSTAASPVVLRSYQLKALPAQPRFREVILPLGCYDRETKKDGPQFGYPGFGLHRLNLIEDLAEKNVIVRVEDRLTRQDYNAVLQRVQYTQRDHPTVKNNIGGILSVVLKKIDLPIVGNPGVVTPDAPPVVRPVVLMRANWSIEMPIDIGVPTITTPLSGTPDNGANLCNNPELATNADGWGASE